MLKSLNFMVTFILWHAHLDKFPDENALHPSRKHKDATPLTIKEIRNYVQFLRE